MNRIITASAIALGMTIGFGLTYVPDTKPETVSQVRTGQTPPEERGSGRVIGY